MNELAQSLNTPVAVALSTTVRAQLSTVPTSAKRGIIVSPKPGNDATIYIGGATVTDSVGWVAALRATDGGILIPVADASTLYAYTTGSASSFGWAVA